jgi:hypothetical protein
VAAFEIINREAQLDNGTAADAQISESLMQGLSLVQSCPHTVDAGS